LKDSQANEVAAQQKLAVQSLRASQVEQLLMENTRLRQLMGLRERVATPAQAAQVLYDAADPYTRKIIIDKGAISGVAAGSPVLDENGVLGQVTQVYPLVSEVTLVTDRDPASRSGALELRFIAAHEDVLPGDLLTTSGVDGVYPAGLPVARVEKVEPRADSAFARITCKPLALVGGVVHVMVFEPAANQIAPRPEPIAAGATDKKGRSK
jgi:rod shape-determining protein MreC